MLQLRQLLEQAVRFDLIQLIVGQQSGRMDKESPEETRKLESLSLASDTGGGGEREQLIALQGVDPLNEFE